MNRVRVAWPVRALLLGTVVAVVLGAVAGGTALLLARREIDHAVPVLDGDRLRAVLTIGKPGRPVTPADQRLMRDVAGGAHLLLQGVARGAELAARVRRVDELAAETAASRQRLQV